MLNSIPFYSISISRVEDVVQAFFCRVSGSGQVVHGGDYILIFLLIIIIIDPILHRKPYYHASSAAIAC